MVGGLHCCQDVKSDGVFQTAARVVVAELALDHLGTSDYSPRQVWTRRYLFISTASDMTIGLIIQQGSFMWCLPDTEQISSAVVRSMIAHCDTR